MKAMLAAAILAAGLAVQAPAGEAADQAAIAAIVPGRIISKPWGWVVVNRSGSTKVIKQAEGGYAVSGPKGSFRLLPREYGFAVSTYPRNMQPATWEDVYAAGRAAKRQPVKRLGSISSGTP